MLLTKVAYLGTVDPAALTFARSCRDMGVSAYLISPRGAEGPFGAHSSCFAGNTVMDPALLGTPAGIDAIIECSRSVGAQALATMRDAHLLWLASNSTHFENRFKLLLPSKDCLNRLVSKIDQIALAESAGFETLPTYVIQRAADVERIDPKHYPLCLRPATDNAVFPHFKVLVVSGREQLLQNLAGWDIHDAVVAQPRLLVPNLLVHCTSNERGELMNAAAFLVDRKFEGVSLRIRPYQMPEGLEDKIRNFSRTVCLSGSYHFEFLVSEETGATYYLEVNARFGGTTDKVRWCGFNETANCFEAYGFTTPKPPLPIPRPFFCVVNKRAIVKHLVTMLRRPPEPWDYPREPRLIAALHSAGDLLFAKDSVFERSDLQGSLAYHLRGCPVNLAIPAGKIIRSVRVNGFWRTVGMAALLPFRRARRCRSEQRRMEVMLQFDREHGTQTAGLVSLAMLDIKGANGDFGVRYGPTTPKGFARILQHLRIPENSTFIDLGSGKGAVLLYASQYAFRRIVGVEFARELHEIALRNIAAYRTPTQKCRDIQTLHLDAAEFSFPEGPLVIFANNPFGPSVWNRVLRNLEEACTDNCERYLIHWNDEQHGRQSPLKLLWEDGAGRIYRIT